MDTRDLVARCRLGRILLDESIDQVGVSDEFSEIVVAERGLDHELLACDLGDGVLFVVGEREWRSGGFESCGGGGGVVAADEV